ncbi:MAG: hypothetical protein AAB445_03380 [Patescibacteria group bacterium]
MTENIGPCPLQLKAGPCNGDVLREEWQEYDPKTGPMVYGSPRNQMRTCVVFHCSHCGTKFAAPPPGTKGFYPAPPKDIDPNVQGVG